MTIAESIRAMFADVRFGPEQMHAYQREAVDFLLANPFSALFIDMGLGKTVTSLTVIAQLILETLLESDDKILIIAPLKVATDVWPTEIATWSHAAWMSYTLIREDDDDPRLAAARARARDFGRAEGLSQAEVLKLANRAETHERERIMRDLAYSKPRIHIINREQVEWLAYLYQENWPYRTVFIDESSSFKDHQSNRFKALQKCRNTTGLITRMHLLTATPAAETYIHFYPQIWLLDQGKRLGKNITAFRKSHFHYDGYKRKYTLFPGSAEKILSKISDICLVMKREDYLPMQEPTIVKHAVKLSQRNYDLIEELEKHFVVTLPNKVELEAKTAAMVASMLLQMASGSVYETKYIEDWDTDDLKKVKTVHDLHDHKIETLRELAEEAATQGEPLLVAYHFQSSLAKLRKAFPKAVVMDKAAKCVKAWNAKKIPMLFIHYQNAGHGLNLQHGGSTMVMYDLTYSLENYLQIIGRIDRQGQTKPVTIHMLIAAKTRDELVAECLAAKEDAQTVMFSLLKRLIRKARRSQLAIEEI